MSLQEVKVAREEVLKIVQENKDKHDGILKTAIEGYWLDAESFLKKNEKDQVEQINKSILDELTGGSDAPDNKKHKADKQQGE